MLYAFVRSGPTDAFYWEGVWPIPDAAVRPWWRGTRANVAVGTAPPIAAAIGDDSRELFETEVPL